MKTQLVCVAGSLTLFESRISNPLRRIDLPVIIRVVPINSRTNELRSYVIKQVFEQERVLWLSLAKLRWHLRPLEKQGQMLPKMDITNHALCSDFPILYPLPEILQVFPTDVMQGDDRLTPKVTTKGDGCWRLPVKQRPVSLQGDTSRLESPCESLISTAQGRQIQAKLTVKWLFLVI